jgi:ABC-type nickel/cobalt efflux system permease component RcnA
MTSRNLFVGLVAIGLIAILASWLWRFLVSDEPVWSATRAQELNEATVNLHEQLHAHGHSHEEDFGDHLDGGEHSHLEHPDAIAASKRYRQTQERLESAKFWRASAALYLRWAGSAMVLGGLIGFYAARSAPQT